MTRAMLSDGRLTLTEQVQPPTPNAGEVVIYSNLSGRLSMVDDTGLVLPGGIQTVGTWTPTLGASTTSGTHTYTTQIGRYVKIGSLVVANFRIQINSKDGAISGSIHIAGLPFISQTTASLNRAGNISFWATLATAFTWMNLFVAPGASIAPIVAVTAAATSASNMLDTAIQNGSRFDGVAIYETDG